MSPGSSSARIGTALALCLAVSAACWSEPEREEGDDGPSAAAVSEVGASAVGAASGVEAVAVVNGVPLPRDEFERELRRNLEGYEKTGRELRPEVRKGLVEGIIRRMVEDELVRQHAAEMGLSVPRHVLVREVEKRRARHGSSDAFDSYLQEAGLTEERFEARLRQEMLKDRVVAELGRRVQLEAGAARRFYEENEERFVRPEQVRVSHILVRVPPGATEIARENRRKRAREALGKLRRGAAFDKIARTYSEDSSSAGRGGDLGFIEKGRLPKAVDEVAWGLERGRLSAIVESPRGFHIVKKTGFRKASQQSFDEVKERIERSLLNRKRDERVERALSSWLESADIALSVEGLSRLSSQARR